MTLTNMRNMLKTCPLPDICFSPSKYNVNNPNDFVEIVNKTKHKKIFNFIPYVRQYSIENNIINDKSVYYLNNDIKLVQDYCLI